MTTRVLVVNLGPGIIEVRVGSDFPKKIYSGETVPVAAGYVYENQEIVVKEYVEPTTCFRVDCNKPRAKNHTSCEEHIVDD
jgi:hypothetical protein